MRILEIVHVSLTALVQRYCLVRRSERAQRQARSDELFYLQPR